MIGYAILALAAASTPCVGDSPPAMVHGEVIYRSGVPPFTGFVETWVQIRIGGRHGSLELLIPYLSKSTVIPDVGAECDFLVCKASVSGQVGSVIQRIEGANVVSRLWCARK